jgi:hypothetical protein
MLGHDSVKTDNDTSCNSGRLIFKHNIAAALLLLALNTVTTDLGFCGCEDEDVVVLGCDAV